MTDSGGGTWAGPSSDPPADPQSMPTPPRLRPHRPTAPPPLWQPPPDLRWSPIAPVAPPTGLGARQLPPWLGYAVAGLLALAVIVVTVTLTQRTVATPTPSVTATPTPSITLASPTPTPSRTTPPAPTASSRPMPSARVDPGPRTWQLPSRSWPALPSPAPRDEVWASLQRTKLNSLAPVDLTGCPAPAVVADEAAWRKAVRAQWKCVHAAWVPVIAKLGWSKVEPVVQFFPGKGSKSACGYLEAPAFYCSAGAGTVYFGRDHFLMAQQWNLSVNEMVNHEYGHHLQKLAGITAAKVEVAASADIERRAELQATCWAATTTWHNRSFEFDQTHYDGWGKRLRTMLVDGVHGSRESILYWGTRGLYATTMGDCNTWVVDSKRVS